ncbi:hypothetical protein E3O25_12585 [Cryobacterium sp. TMT1-3]|uniref:Uncharacterized protein n=1 Tax=Cryobacterium luteum TaxID=1424661 RepID=A0A1H8DXF5_9MICO|nr:MULTISPECIES: hypothetical protein [Cryobacterium]TFB89739.1 hypothetical protein E3O10_08025 [Cryobacterium luteum]TFC25451.1 hypothetical protein E3O25_12585 [Cryobacterium sp. TMT1-3]SEN11238.1 hypothetical protein SAMN05216281_10446 [Cryobacterium luteum]
MTLSLTDLLAEPTSGRRRAVVLDSHDYAQTVFLQGKPVPWQEPMAYANFFGQVQGVLGSDLALLSLDRYYAQRVAADPALQSAMGAKSRTGYALRTLLNDAETTASVVELATVFSQTQRVPVVLQIPSPMQWLARTHPFSGSDDVLALDADNAENASMYVADWLRGFAALPLIAVLLDDRGPVLEPVPLSTYSPIANVTDHYRWALGQRHDDRVELHGSALRGAVIGTDFWSTDADPLPEGDFLVGEVPHQAVPEQVLSRITALI